NIAVDGTTIGTLTDETGHYQLLNMPTGEITVVASFIGYKSSSLTITTEKNTTKELHFELEPDVLKLEEVVVTANRNGQRKSEVPVIVNTIPPKMIENTQSVTISEGLNFCSGVRTENNCQNCGFTQVRLNGMEGPYSQVLINSRPIFSGLAGVYGLELFPANMIEKIEVIRGGGSALYGSNAIAGTINVIMKDPRRNSYSASVNGGLMGVGNGYESASTYNLNFNSSLVSDDRKRGLALYGFNRNRQPFDANGDSFSELSQLANTTFGTRIYQRFGYRGRLTFDFFTIKENHRGGNRFDYPVHEADIAEAVDHNINTGAVTYEHFFREHDLLSLYLSGQHIKREAYYGAQKALSDYGRTLDLTTSAGAQYKLVLGNGDFTGGIEYTAEHLKDTKMGYLDIQYAVINQDTTGEVSHTTNSVVANQESSSLGFYGQYNVAWKKFRFSIGGRFDTYQIQDAESLQGNRTGNVFSPRFNVLYPIFSWMQARLSYSQGYRAPQIFDEDLHIESSASRKVVHVNDPNLVEETSRSYMFSLDLNKQFNTRYAGFLMECFYTRLSNPFANEYGIPDENGLVVYTRVNAAGGADVMGVNTEFTLVVNDKVKWKSGFTYQKSQYDSPQEFNEHLFFRTPDSYGFTTLNYNVLKEADISVSGKYTGRMHVPYFGNTLENPSEGMLVESDPFYDLSLKASYIITTGAGKVKLFCGVKNIFNYYQDDFDSGIDRDPGYVYGPGSPRTIYAGVKIGSLD
ncbi:MAG: TonB-dependent receptor, partial [Marinilabiliales bacterium]